MTARRPPFEPSRWAAGPHAQTLIARVLRSKDGPDFERERFTTPDGDFLDVDWGPDPGPGAGLVLILHGLEGSSGRPYIRNVSRQLLRLGVRPVALNFRGCSGEPNRSLRFYHSGETGDPGWILAQMRRRFPTRRIGAVGFSLGGNMLLKLMGERPDGGSGALDAAVAVSVPYDLAAGCAFLEGSRMGRMYSWYFLRMLKRKVALKASRLAGVLDLAAVVAARTIWEFDDLVTAPLAGFRDAAEYYALSSSSEFLSRVRVPTLLIHSEDDPFLPATAIPVETATANPDVTLSLQRAGGHVGFVEGPPWRPTFWADAYAARFLADRLRLATKSALGPTADEAPDAA